MKKTISTMLLLLSSVVILAQQYTISGSLKDATNGEDLIGAAISIEELPGTGTVANTYGFFSLSLPKGNYTINIQYIGYQGKSIKINLDKDQKLNLELSPASESLQEVVVTSEAANANVTKTQMSVAKLNPKDVETVPVLFGEKDIIKTIQLLPGVKSAGEGGTGFSVRGGGFDQNLILLDEAPVYNASHLLGFFSVFNSDAIKDVTLYKGGIPASYGGRASSVMDVVMKDGNSKKFGVSGGIGVIASKLTVEGPIVKDKGSFIVSARRTYADLFLKLSPEEDLNKSTLYFYDLNLKANYKLSDNDRIYISGYFGRDKFGFGDEFGFDWGNATATIRWNHLYSKKLFGNTSLIFSDYNYGFELGDENETFSLKSGIQDYNIKQDFSYYYNSKNTMKFGGNLIYHNFIPGEVTITGGGGGIDDIEQQYAIEAAAYMQNEQSFGNRWTVNYGLRFSYFNYMGKGTAYDIDEFGNIISEKTYKSGESIQDYYGLEPRISAKYLIDDVSSIKLGLDRNFQFLHLLSNSTSGSPTDRWVPSSNNVKPQIGNQIAAGYFRNLDDNKYEFSVETYYKKLQNMIDYRTGADLVLNGSVETELVYGEGEAFGAEFLFRKNQGKFTGWLSYTLSRTLRQFDDIDNGDPFPARQDRIHDISITGIYTFNEKWCASANFIYYTGDAVSFPSGKYRVEDREIPYYTERNGYRFPDYHRLDLGVTWIKKKTEKFESSWNFSIYNAYGRQNPYIINFRESETVPGKTEAVQLSLFGVIPSISYNFKF